ncbi:Uma2 family endonuclease [Microcystis sp. M061S2]|uniref:Uma2 family endonuclease n=1 Tax=Microcystis sp. M061S2 TaxID=2771171 RepID=UPI00258F4968|nr:Uma2 family endonuclease [Microcystis sp. M061S2]MCA2653083.1 Uma2 family endonuclease [Microcystis sp. M061S2]
MFALVSTDKIELPAVSLVRLPATWLDYQTLSRQRGDNSRPKIKYHNGEVLLMSPLPKHGRDAHLIANIIITLLDYLGREYEAFTRVTMELPETSGIQPDYSFYIDHWPAIAGKARIDWANDPPPDLVLEIDVTSYSNVDDYLPYQVPEIWLYRQKNLYIYRLENQEYIPRHQSQYFPNFNLQNLVSFCGEIADNRNSSMAIRQLKQHLEDFYSI